MFREILPPDAYQLSVGFMGRPRHGSLLHLLITFNMIFALALPKYCTEHSLNVISKDTPLTTFSSIDDVLLYCHHFFANKFSLSHASLYCLPTIGFICNTSLKESLLLASPELRRFWAICALTVSTDFLEVLTTQRSLECQLTHQVTSRF